MDIFQLTTGEGPLVAAAIHSGHAVRADLEPRFALSEEERRREEDPYTDQLAALAPTHIVGLRSRFEVDLNRPREQAVYLQPVDAWGLEVWREPPPDDVVAESLANYDLLYATVHALLEQKIRQHGRVVVLDLHSYNHRREGPAGPAADAVANPEINLGTQSVDRTLWGAVVDRVAADLRAGEVGGRRLDVRENVKFFGGHFPRWINATFGGRACAIAVEFKKTFMNEWTGTLDREHFASLEAALRTTIAGVGETLKGEARG